MTAPYRQWICEACGFIYDEAQGDPDSGLAPGTRYEDIPDDWQCPWCGMAKSDLRPLDAPAPAVAAAEPETHRRGDHHRGGPDHVVILGAGIAGWSVAEALRRRDRQVPILLVTACDGASYSKPALSTAFTLGKSADDLVQHRAAERAAQLGIDIRVQTRLLKIDRPRKRLITAAGGIRYGRLVLALGAQPRPLPIEGDAVDQPVHVNSLADYRKLRNRLDGGARHVTLLGAGLVGCEFAEDLSRAGFQVDVIDPGAYPLARLVPRPVGEQLLATLKERGVGWHMNATLRALSHGARGMEAQLSDGSRFDTDLVLAATGLVPNVQLAEAAGLTVAHAVATDRGMRTSDPDVFALGDCAAVDGQVYAYIEPIRRQAQTVAAALLGEDAPFQARPPLIKVKTPSFPLTVCPPQDAAAVVPMINDDPRRFDFILRGRRVGFVLTGTAADKAPALYRETFG